MRILSKMSLAVLAIVIPAAFAACNNGPGDEEDLGGAGGNTGGGNTGGGNTGGGNTGGGNTGGGNTGGSGGMGMGAMGGADNTGGGGSGGGSGGTPPTEPPFEPSDCLSPGGPNADVLSSGIGAFVEEDDWMAGWTNWSVNSTPEDDGSAPTVALDADIDADLELDASEIYELVGTVHVLDGATLTIPAGTLFKSGGSSSLVVSRGGRLVAEGTAEAPIVFTSKAANGLKAAGQWGGIIILGNASNWSGPNVNVEGLATDPLNQYGDAGDDPIEDQDSGSLEYVRIEFGGTELLDGNEINGLTMGSVGSGTRVSYVQVNTTWDDGFEWFGGSVSGDHLVSNNAGDDMFDMDQGFTGEVHTIFGRQVATVKADPNGFEWDSSLSDLQPATHPVVSNVTLCGVPEGKPNYGMVLRELIQGDIDNVAFTGFDYGIDLRDDVSTDLSLTDSYSWGHYGGLANAAEADNDGGVDEAEWFLEQDGNVDFDE